MLKKITKRASRILVGSILAAVGIGIAMVGGYYILAGRLTWIVIAIAGGALVVAGIRTLSGDSLKDVLKDLLFVFVRTH